MLLGTGRISCWTLLTGLALYLEPKFLHLRVDLLERVQPRGLGGTFSCMLWCHAEHYSSCSPNAEPDQVKMSHFKLLALDCPASAVKTHQNCTCLHCEPAFGGRIEWSLKASICG